MTLAETRYSTFDRELLAVYLSIKHFRHFLGRPFQASELSIRSTLAQTSSPPQLHFPVHLYHSPRMWYVVADALSRIETNALLTGQPPNVFFRYDVVRNPYDGPYPVAVQTNKHFTVTVNGRNTTISIDRLNPAHLDLESNTEHSLTTTESLPNEQSHHIPISSHLTPHSHSPLPPSHTSIHTPTTPRSTHSGRRVHFLQYFSHHV